MRRIQFLEIHEQPWFPSSLRDGVTDALQFGFNLLQFYASIVPLLRDALDGTAGATRDRSYDTSCELSRPDRSVVDRRVVDLCSGGGGPWLDLCRRLQARRLQTSESEDAPILEMPILEILLTDKYPNLAAFQEIALGSKIPANVRVTFHPDPVDARNVPGQLQGLRTLFTSFHHFRPGEARAILQNAVDGGEGIAIFEASRRSLLSIALVLPLVLVHFACTPWIRPFRWSRLFWTYLVPIIPLVLWFDGVVSCLRSYRPQELQEMVGTLTAGASGREYEWKMGEHSSAVAGAPITYLIGYPRLR